MTASRVVIGVDESGKGDFFGPLVIAAFSAPDSACDGLVSLGVRDSKLIAEKKLLGIAASLRDNYPHELVVIGPEKYNELYSQIRNLNKLLAWGHARAIENLLLRQEADLAISDKFGKPELIEKALLKKGRTIEVQQLVRGEAITQVAAASILARAGFVGQMRRLSEQVGVTLPRGAGAEVDLAARRLVESQGAETLEKVAKTHFRNYQRATDLSLGV